MATGVALHSVPAAATPMLVTVPPGVAPGSAVMVVTPSGQQYQVTVPAGATEGSQFQIMVGPGGPAAPVAQSMDRKGSASFIYDAVERLGGGIGMRLKSARYSQKDDGGFLGWQQSASGTLPIQDASGKDALMLHFSAIDRNKGQLSAKLTTADGSIVVAELHREGGNTLGYALSSQGGSLCEVKVGGVLYATVPGGYNEPELTRTDRSGGVRVQSGCMCCPCQTMKTSITVWPGNTFAMMVSANDGNCFTAMGCCGADWTTSRKVTCPLVGDARAQLDVLLICSFWAASLLTAPRHHSG